MVRISIFATLLGLMFTFNAVSQKIKLSTNTPEHEKVAGELVKDPVLPCGKPTTEDFLAVCSSVYTRSEPKEPTDNVYYNFQEHLWKMSCADPKKDSLEVAAGKIRKMWNENRELFRCEGFAMAEADRKNILKFRPSNLNFYFTSRSLIPIVYQPPIKQNTSQIFI